MQSVVFYRLCSNLCTDKDIIIVEIKRVEGVHQADPDIVVIFFQEIDNQHWAMDHFPSELRLIECVFIDCVCVFA
jgi:hypothetical protein